MERGKGGGGGGDQNEPRYYIVWFGKVRPKTKGRSQLTILVAHLTNYTFIADKVHKNPYIDCYTLL